MEKYVLTTEPFTFETKLERPNFVLDLLGGIVLLIISPLIGISLARQVERTSTASFTGEFFANMFAIFSIIVPIGGPILGIGMIVIAIMGFLKLDSYLEMLNINYKLWSPNIVIDDYKIVLKSRISDKSQIISQGSGYKLRMTVNEINKEKIISFKLKKHSKDFLNYQFSEKSLQKDKIGIDELISNLKFHYPKNFKMMSTS